MVFDSDIAMRNIIVHVGERSEACRSYWFRIDHDKQIIDNEYEWCSEGTTPQQDSLRNVPFDALPWLTSSLKDDRWVKTEYCYVFLKQRYSCITTKGSLAFKQYIKKSVEENIQRI